MSEVIFKRMEAARTAREFNREHKIKMFLMSPIRRAHRAVYGDVGLELEIEGENLPGPDKVRAGDAPVDTGFPVLAPQTAYHWVATRDGSLRGDNFEYVTSGPIKIEEVEGMLRGLWAEFEKADSQLHLSNRCSTHVHLNFSMLTPRPITSMIALWSMVEEIATNWCGDQRVSNPFCLRAKDSLATVEKWMEQLEGGNPEWTPGLKYNSMNLKPLWDRGSIEFRCLRGAENPEMVIKWVKFLWALREEARTTYQNPMKLAADVSAMSAYGVIDRIVRDRELIDFWTEMLETPGNENAPEKVRTGFLLVQPMLFGTNWSIVEDKEELGSVVENDMLLADRDLRVAEWNVAQARLRNPPEVVENALPVPGLDMEEDNDFLPHDGEFALAPIVRNERQAAIDGLVREAIEQGVIAVQPNPWVQADIEVNGEAEEGNLDNG